MTHVEDEGCEISPDTGLDVNLETETAEEDEEEDKEEDEEEDEEDPDKFLNFDQRRSENLLGWCVLWRVFGLFVSRCFTLSGYWIFKSITLRYRYRVSESFRLLSFPA